MSEAPPRPIRRWLRTAGGILTALLVIGACRAIAMCTGPLEWGSNGRTARVDVVVIDNAIGMYYVKHEHLPGRLDELVPNKIREIRHDPWGHAYVYLRSEDSDLVEVVSAGPDGLFGTRDDIIVWSRTPELR